MERRLPVGAEVQPGGGTHFRVWAPASQTAGVEFFSPEGKIVRTVPLAAEAQGYFSGFAADAKAGDRYKIKLDHGSFPDPVSRFQPDGVHGPSQIIDPAFRWTDSGWRGRATRELVIYELHLGTFTPKGTWRAAIEQLPELARFGITMIEIMPIAEFPGQFGWGYDGVDIFAPTRLYGAPDEGRRFVNRAHELGMAVILDVVYNHLGPEGNFLRQFSDDYFNPRYACEWGQALNFDGQNAGPAREFFISNARYWIDEFHFDGLRLDATQQMFDGSSTHVLIEIGRAARAAGKGRTIYLVAENESQHGRLVREPETGGYGLDALWNDDFHHAARVAATGKADAYYADYRGNAQEFVSAVKYGFLYQGQKSRWQQARRGTPALDLRPTNFVCFLQNHDQVANSLRGLPLHQLTSPGKLRALTALLLLQPATPMLFQGQEFAASAPFLYFADHPEGLREKVAEGRKKFLRQFRAIASEECATWLPDPDDPATFRNAKLDFAEREKHQPIYRMHADLLRLRREEKAADCVKIDGAVLANEAFVLRYFMRDGDDRLLLVNLGVDLYLDPAPEPLLAPLQDRGWRVGWSTESPEYGGSGTPLAETDGNWIFPGQAAMWLVPDGNGELPHARITSKD